MGRVEAQYDGLWKDKNENRRRQNPFHNALAFELKAASFELKI